MLQKLSTKRNKWAELRALRIKNANLNGFGIISRPANLDIIVGCNI